MTPPSKNFSEIPPQAGRGGGACPERSILDVAAVLDPPLIRLIKEHVTQLDNRFSFEQMTYEDIHKEIKKN